MAEVKYIVFALNDQKYSIRLSKINGIEYVYNIVPVPTSAPCIKGIIHLRNQVIPIYSLKERFQLDESVKAENPQLLIVESHGYKLGVEVDDVLGIVPVESSDVKVVPKVVQGEGTVYLENVIKVTLPEATHSDICLSISMDNIMSQDEFDELQQSLNAQE